MEPPSAAEVARAVETQPELIAAAEAVLAWMMALCLVNGATNRLQVAVDRAKGRKDGTNA